MQDVNRLRERVLDLQRHFGLANADVEKILTSAEKITSRGRKIENLDLENGQDTTPVISNGNGADRLAV
jgi:DNA recombination protein RmuC